MPGQQGIGVSKGIFFHPIEDIMVFRDSQTIFFFVMNIGVLVHPLFVDYIVQPIDKLTPPYFREGVLVASSEEREGDRQPKW